MVDVQSAMKELFAETLQSILEAVFDSELGFKKYETTNKETFNSRNVTSRSRSIITEFDIEITRDRNGDFEPMIVKKHQKNVTGIEDQIITMYAKA